MSKKALKAKQERKRVRLAVRSTRHRECVLLDNEESTRRLETLVRRLNHEVFGNEVNGAQLSTHSRYDEFPGVDTSTWCGYTQQWHSFSHPSGAHLPKKEKNRIHIRSVMLQHPEARLASVVAHEMIHALLEVRGADWRSNAGHGKEFKAEMRRVNPTLRAMGINPVCVSYRWFLHRGE
jgi:SprT-like family